MFGNEEDDENDDWPEERADYLELRAPAVACGDHAAKDGHEIGAAQECEVIEGDSAAALVDLEDKGRQRHLCTKDGGSMEIYKIHVSNARRHNSFERSQPEPLLPSQQAPLTPLLAVLKANLQHPRPEEALCILRQRIPYRSRKQYHNRREIHRPLSPKPCDR